MLRLEANGDRILLRFSRILAGRYHRPPPVHPEFDNSFGTLFTTITLSECSGSEKDVCALYLMGW